MVGWSSAEQLHKELVELERRVQDQTSEDLSFRKLNVNFSVQNETTQMLMDVCEKLAKLKESMQRANFEEHSTELPYLCKHFGTSIEAGLPERVARERHAARYPAGCGDSRRRGGFFALCCQSEFPPHQAWWTELSKQLAPTVQVLRSGKLAAAPASGLVPGDVFYLRAGQRAAVDGRILVHSPGTLVDFFQLTGDVTDVRLSTVESAGDTAMASRNMVFRDSYVVNGSLFCVCVRSASDPMLPFSSRDLEDDQFIVDANVPSGMSMSQGKAAFKALCIQSRLACRSFQALQQLGRVGVLVVLVTQELLASAAALCSSARRLGKAVVLVGCRSVSQAALESLSQQASMELLDLGSGEPSRAGTPRSGSPLRGGSSRALSSQPLVQSPSQGEATQLTSLVQRLVGQRAGVVLAGLSQPGLISLCSRLADAGQPPLYAEGNMEYPDAFRSLVMVPRSKPFSSRLIANATPPKPPKGSVVLSSGVMSEAQSIVPLEKSTAASQASPSGTPAVAQEESHRVESKDRMLSRLQSLGSQGTASANTLNTDPAATLALPRTPGGKSVIELFVSLNSIGIASEHADCVLLKPDLACLGQALEIAAKVAPTVPTAQ